jgi:hypothetical protein
MGQGAEYMGQVLVVTSGKGGVGKTTSTAALGAALAHDGQKVVVVDFDVGLRNLDLVLGAERRVVFDLINVINGFAKLSQALIRDKRLTNLYLLPASQTRDKDALTEEGVARSSRSCGRNSTGSSATARRGSSVARQVLVDALAAFRLCRRGIEQPDDAVGIAHRGYLWICNDDCGSLATILRAPRAAKCWRSTTCLRFYRAPFSASFQKAKK